MNVTNLKGKSMGLAAGQARLLTITSRKSDCEFESMRLSHQKIALARELADLSNEYQYALDQSKLVYDYYGTGDTSIPLNYGTLMTPSQLNDYMPTIVTDSMGRVVLNSKYAAAARAAGIPQEGLGSLQSETVRNNFIAALAGQKIITDDMATSIMSLPYNQGAGYGEDATVTVNYKTVTYSTLLESYFSGVDVSTILDPFRDKYVTYDGTLGEQGSYRIKSYDPGIAVNDYRSLKTIPSSNLTIKDLLKGDASRNGSHYMLCFDGADNGFWEDGFYKRLTSSIKDSFWNQLFDAMFSVLDNGSTASTWAFDYAKTAFMEEILEGEGKYYYSLDHKKGKSKHEEGLRNEKVGKLNGVVVIDNDGPSRKKLNAFAGIDLTNALQQFLTYYAIAYNGLEANTDVYGNEILYVAPRWAEQWQNRLVKDDTTFELYESTDISDGDFAVASFYDALFNQICINGWVENENIEDPDYLQKMLQSGMLYISKAKDDHYYYQGNYAIDPYIKEITDDTYIAQAEAKYNTEKAKLNSKEETIDLKMKKIDTEISSLTTEYDTIKNTISKNIERSFKRYDA